MPDRKHSTAVLLEVIDFDEYEFLIPRKRELIRLILSCEYVDLSDGGKVLTKLYELFPEGTATKANIDALIFEIED